MSANVEAAYRFVDAFNRRDVEGLAEVVTDDFYVRPVRALVEDISYRGRDGLEEWMNDLTVSWSDIAIELVEVAELTPETLLAVGRVTGHGQESAVPVDTHLAWLGKARDGLFSSLETYASREDALRAAAGLG